jgi:NADH-quinone oxidoreductase subunit C
LAGSLNELGENLAARFGAAIMGRDLAYGELTIAVETARIVEIVRFLKEDPECRFVCFIDLCGVDYPDRARRFEVVYHLLSPYRNQRVRLKVAADEDTPLPSLVEVFPAANWYEREVYDLYGVLFSGHPDLRRILTDYGFSGHPLRKDFPLTGHVEVRYDVEAKRVVYEPVRLMQEFRNFDYLSPWEGTDYILPGDEKVKQ